MTAHHSRLRLLLVYALLSAPAIVYGAMMAMQANNNSPLDWVPSSFPPKSQYDAFCTSFGPGDVVVLSWPGCTLVESRLDQLADVLRTAHVFHNEAGEWLFAHVATGREAVAALVGVAAATGSSWAPADAASRLRGSLVGPDGATTAVVVAFTGEGLKQRQRLVGLIRQAAVDFCGVSAGDLRLAGPVIDGLSVDQASQASLDRFAAPSGVIVFLLCWASLRSLKGALVVFGMALYCQAGTLALVHFAGDSMSALLIVLPPLVQVLAVAGGIHLANYFFAASRRDPNDNPAMQALRMGWLPCVLSSATTAIGMASLCVSQLSPIRAFGGYAACGVVLTTGVLLALLPACFSFWPPAMVSAETTQRVKLRGRPLRWTRWAALLERHHAWVAVSGLTAIAVGSFFLTRVKTSVRIETLFAPESRILADYAWLEEHVAPTVPLEIVLVMDPRAHLSETSKLSLLAALGARLSADGRLTGAFSAAQCLPPLPETAPPNWPPAAVEQLILAARPAFAHLGLLVIEEEHELWRLTVRCSALGDANYPQLLMAIRAQVDQTLRDAGATSPGIEARVTGIMPLVHELQQQLLNDLVTSFLSALALITLVMTVVQAGVRVGLLAMAPNVFPIVVLFGLLGWMEAPVDIGVVMTASVALGIAVDDTLHFLTFFRRGLDTMHSQRRAVEYALEHCGRAMIQTSISCGLGLLVFGLSDFLPTSRFAWSMVVLLGLALAGDLILLPALLLGPCGRLWPQRVPTTRVPHMPFRVARPEPHALSASIHQ